MEAIENKLYQYSVYQKKIKELEDQINEILDKKDALAQRVLRGQSLDSVRVMGGFSSDPVFAAVQKMIDVYGTRIDAIRNELIDLYCLLDSITSLIDNAGLTESERQYIKYRYFDGLKASQTAAKMGYSEAQILRIKKRLLEKLTDK